MVYQGRYFGGANSIRQDEVLDGPTSVLFGAESPVGNIDMAWKRAQDRDFGEVR